MNQSTLLLSVIAVAVLPCRLPAGDDLKIECNDRGPASIVHHGVELLAANQPGFRLRDLNFVDPKAKDGNRQVYEPKLVSQQFDPDKRTLVQLYAECRVECVFTPKANRLDLQITLTNNTPDVIRRCEFLPLVLRLPHTVRNAFRWDRGTFLADVYDHEKGTVIVTPSGRFTYGSRDGRYELRPLSISGPTPENRPHHPIVDDSYWYDPGTMLAPGKSGTYCGSLVFGPPDATPQECCPEAYRDYVQTHPFELKWPDRRPIATVFLCNSATGWKTNPRGWFQDAKVDVVTEEGRRAFGERLTKYADSCIARMQKMKAQGVIVWDIEGQEMPHMISYIGDPRQIAALGPEMDQYADAFMKRFRDAGFRTGITIRPTEVYQPNKVGQPAWNQREVKDPVATMSEKIRYAQRRWGCTIFYLDSSVFGDGLLTPEQKQEMRGIPWVMPGRMFEKLARLHPDCLISPEFAIRDHYRFGAPYSSPNLGDGGTDPRIRQLWPEAFRLVAVRRNLLESRWEHFVESVEKGDVLMCPPWYDAEEITFVELLYREAAIRRSGALTTLAGADAAALAEKVKDPAEAMRYAAVTALGKLGTPAAVATLTAMLKDDSPLVQKQALAGLAQAKKIDERACIALLTEWIQDTRDPIRNALRSRAAEALARAGDAAVPALVDLLSSKHAGVWPHAIRALGRTGTTEPAARQALIGFLGDDLPQKRQLHVAAVEALGLLRVKEAVPALVAILDQRDRDSEDLRGAAVVALGRIGDARAVQPLVKQFDVGYSTVVVYWIRDAIDASLRSITAEQAIVGAEEWKAWSAGKR